MKLLFEECGLYIYSFELKTERLEYYLIDNICGLIATFSISDNKIYHFETGSSYCFNNHKFYIEAIEKCFKINL